MPLSLHSTSVLQQRRKIALLGLKIRIASDVLLADVDVGDGGLAIDFL